MISKKRVVLLVLYLWISLGLVFHSGSVRGARVAGQEDVTSTVDQTTPPEQERPAPPASRGRPPEQAQASPAQNEQPEPEPEKPAAVKQERPPNPSEESRYVTIDFDGVDISLLIKFISELTGKNFIIDKAVRGNVTIISPSKITVNEAYKVFESVLEINGFTTVEAGAVIKIVPSLEARSKDIETRLEKEVKDPKDRLVTQLIPLKYADPEEIKRTFAPFVSKNSVIVSYPPTGMLIITDVQSNIKRLLNIIKVIDMEGIGEEITVITLEHATASVLAKSLDAIFQQPAARRPPVRGQTRTESVVESAVKVIPDERTNSLILLASANDTVKIREVIKLLDRERPRGEGDIHVYYLQNSNAEELHAVLTALPSKTAPAEAAQAAAPVSVSRDVQIVADKATNSLVITAKKADYLILEDVIKKLDIPRPMVYIEALIMEVSLFKDFNLGVEWQAVEHLGTRTVRGEDVSIGAFGSSRPGPSTLPSVSPTGLAVFPSGFTMGVLGETISIGGVRFPTIAAVINAFQSDSDVNILSTPQIMTIDNEEAEIVVADNIPFLTRISETTAGQAIENFEYRDVGVTLRITPQINQERFVRLVIYQEVSEVISQNLDRPSTLKRQAKTTVLIRDGHTIVIGGLISETLNRSKSQVPCLGDVIGLGALFRSVSNSSNRTNLFIFLTPHIVANPMEAEEVFQEKKGQIEWQKESSVKLYLGRERFREDMRLNDKGFNYLQAGNYDKAEEYFERALEINPDNPYAILNMGIVYERRGNIQEAVRMYEKVITLNPRDRANESVDIMMRGRTLVDIALDNLIKLKLKGNTAQ